MLIISSSHLFTELKKIPSFILSPYNRKVAINQLCQFILKCLENELLFVFHFKSGLKVKATSLQRPLCSASTSLQRSCCGGSTVLCLYSSYFLFSNKTVSLGEPLPRLCRCFFPAKFNCKLLFVFCWRICGCSSGLVGSRCWSGEMVSCYYGDQQDKWRRSPEHPTQV